MAAETEDRSEVVNAGEKLNDKVAFVTGGTRGIGAAICRSLAGQGAAVAAGYSGDQERAETFLSELLEHGIGASVHKGNIASGDDCRRSVEEVLERHGRIDILVNNAGITADAPVLKLSDEDWRKVLDVNLSGAFYLSKAVLPHMLERGSGRIVNISSLIGEMGNVGQANYAAAKSGLFGFTKTLAREAAQELGKADKLGEDSLGVTVNTVAPGFIATEMLESVPEKVIEGIKKQIPASRLGRPDEVARVVHFLASDASSYITGQVWDVNGGMDM